MISVSYVIKKYSPATMQVAPIGPYAGSTHTFPAWLYAGNDNKWNADPANARKYASDLDSHNALEQLQEPGTVYVIETILVSE